MNFGILETNFDNIYLKKINDTPPDKLDMVATPLQATVRTMAFFEKLSENGNILFNFQCEFIYHLSSPCGLIFMTTFFATNVGIVSATGSLKGCFEEIYHGYTVSPLQYSSPPHASIILFLCHNANTMFILLGWGQAARDACE
jgi:hypothetical protein